ncbi:MAG: MFS transporter [Sterolibacteriaceae bacterium]|nr:MFS transporter [Candidatus Methylophosphatis haderslevensis]
MSNPPPLLDASAYSPWKVRAFLHYWFARVGSMGAYQMQVVATGWLVYELTGSALDLGLVGLVQFLPRVALTLWAGALADRHDRRRIAMLCMLAQLAACAALAAGAAAHALSRVTILALVGGIGAARAFEMPAMQSLLPRLVGTRQLPRALAMSSAAMQTAIVGGPALGGLIFLAGAPVVYAVAGAAFLAAALLMFTLPAPTDASATVAHADQSLFAGLRYVRQQPVILGAISLDLFAVLLCGATALLPIFARDILNVGPGGLGLLQAAPAAGALAMSLYLAQRPLSDRVGRTLFASVAVFGIGTIVFALSTSFLLSLGALALLGAADSISVVIRQSLVQLETPDAMRGRVSAVNSVFIGASNQLGEFESGVAAALLGTVPSVVAGGLGTLLIAALWIRLFPALWRRDRLV